MIYKKHWINYLRFWKYFSLKAERIKVEGNKIVLEKGLIKKDSKTLYTQSLDGIAVNKSLFGRLLGYGDVLITTPSMRYTFKRMKKPENLQNDVHKIMYKEFAESGTIV